MYAKRLKGAAITLAVVVCAISIWHLESYAQTPETLKKLIDQAIEGHPRIMAALRELKAVEGEVTQAGLLPNPELTIEVENFGGTGPRSGFTGSETTLSLEQPVLLGGKRAKRIRLARLRKRLSAARIARIKAEVAGEVEGAFWELAAAARSHSLAKEMLSIARKGQEAVAKKVEAGQVAPLELYKAKVLVAAAEIEAKSRFYRLAEARARLEAAVGREVVAIPDVPIHKEPLPPLGIASRPDDAIGKSPIAVELRLEAEVARASSDLMEALAVPDLKLGMGIRHFEEDGGQAVVASLSIPLHIFDRRQGDRLAAKQRVLASEQRARAGRLALLRRLRSAWSRAQDARQEAERLLQQAIPKAKASLDAAAEGYRYGKFGYIEVLDAQRTLFEVQLQSIDAISRYYQAKAEISAIIGSSGHTVKR